MQAGKYLSLVTHSACLCVCVRVCASAVAMLRSCWQAVGVSHRFKNGLCLLLEPPCQTQEFAKLSWRLGSQIFLASVWERINTWKIAKCAMGYVLSPVEEYVMLSKLPKGSKNYHTPNIRVPEDWSTHFAMHGAVIRWCLMIQLKVHFKASYQKYYC